MTTKHHFRQISDTLWMNASGDRLCIEDNGNQEGPEWVYRHESGKLISTDQFLADLAARYKLVLSEPQQAPNPPLSTLIFIEDTNDTLEIFPVLHGQIEVRMRENNAPVQHVLLIPTSRKDDVEWLYNRCNTWRVATFRMLCEQLGKA